MVLLGKSFRLLNRERFTPLIELCPHVCSRPWNELTDEEREILSYTRYFLEHMQARGLVETEYPVGAHVLPTAIPRLRFRRIPVEGEMYVNEVVASAIYTLLRRRLQNTNNQMTSVAQTNT